MGIKFVLDGNSGVEIVGERGDELTVDEARVVAMIGLEKQLSVFNHNVGQHFEEFRFKKFFDEDSADAAERERQRKRPA